MAVHCPECGFVNPEGANYCQKCGAYLGRPEGADEPTTMTYKVDETGEYTPVDIEEEVEDAGAALVIRSGGGRAGESFQISGDRMSIGRTPDAGVFLDDVTVSRNHALLVRRQDGIYHRRPWLAQRLLRQPPPDRVAPPGGRRRDPDRQIQALVPGGLRWRPGSAKPRRAHEAQRRDRERDSRPRKALTIGAVAKILSQEFDDISISKIRYLEDQKLLAPRRTPGGYRLYSQADVERLQAILRMQRDEFLPLRVIRQELATGTFDAERRPAADVGQKRRALTVDSQVQTMSAEELGRAGRRERRVPARDERVRRRPARARPTGARASTRRTSRSSAPPPSWRSTVLPAGTSASFAPRPTARRRSSSSFSAPRFARAAPPAGARRSKTSRTSPRSAGTSSSSSWSATFAASRATRADPPARGPVPRPDEGHPHAQGRGARPTPSGASSPTRTACRAGGRR